MEKRRIRPIYSKSGILLATDFVRIEHGGRGDYIEIKPSQILQGNLYIPKNLEWKLSNKARNTIDYIEFRSIKDHIKVYYQVNTQYVDYANYRIGYFYISPKHISRKRQDILKYI